MRIILLTIIISSFCAIANTLESQPVKPFELEQVRLLDGPFKDAMERDRRWLLDLDVDRLLYNFHVTAGLPSSSQPYGGWETPDHILRGSFPGHYMTACSLMYQSTEDERFKKRGDKFVTELAKCQKALGDSGYLSAFPETFFDDIEAGEPGRVGISRVSWYVVHKIMVGLYDAYVYCDNQQALEVLNRMASWAKWRIDRLTDEHTQEMLDIEHGGMIELMLDLYKITQNPEHYALARRFEHNRIFNPLANCDGSIVTYLHGNSTVPKILGAAGIYELSGNDRYHTISEFFWHEVVNTRSYVTGGSTNHEHWCRPNELAGELSVTTAESCVSYNMLKLTRQLFSWQPLAEYADYYERVLFNHILGAQNPEDGEMMYYVPMASGYWKGFRYGEFTCCTATGSESYAKLSDSIYFYDDEGIFVNLFIASEMDWSQKGLKIRQETNFPVQQGTKFIFSVKNPVELAVRIRVPYWTAEGGSVKLNGQTSDVLSRPGSFYTLKRTWKDGDTVEVSLPMSLRLESMPDDKTVAAIMYGPILLAGQLGTTDMTGDMIQGRVNPYSHEPVPAEMLYFFTDSDDLSTWIKPISDKTMSFRTVGQETDITLVPFYQLFGQRYGVYWRIFEKDSAAYQSFIKENNSKKAHAKRVVDRVINKNSHNLNGGGNHWTGSYKGQDFHRAVGGGWFSYDLAVQPDKPMVLACTYWGSEGGFTFDILVNDTKIADQILNKNKPEEFFTVEYDIPEQLIKSKDYITVKFQARPDSVTAMVFGCETLIRKEAEKNK